MTPCESTQGATPWPSNLSLFEVARHEKETDAVGRDTLSAAGHRGRAQDGRVCEYGRLTVVENVK